MSSGVATSFLSTLIRGTSGIQVTTGAEKPAELLQLYDTENCSYCRLVREALTRTGSGCIDSALPEER